MRIPPIAVCLDEQLEERDEILARLERFVGPIPIVVLERDDPADLPPYCSAVIGLGVDEIRKEASHREIPVCIYQWDGDEPFTEWDRDHPVPGVVLLERGAHLLERIKEQLRWLLDRWAATVQRESLAELSRQARDAVPLWPVWFDGASGRRYYFAELIGLGGTAVVARVTDGLGRPYAAKALSAHRFPFDATSARFEREGDLLAGIDHPNVVRFVDRAEVGPSAVIVMEDLSGGSLHERIEGMTEIGWELALQWVREVLSGLDHLHARQIVHRDLTPKNLMFRGDGSLVVGDFGTVRHLDDETLTRSIDQIGSLVYVPPEQFAAPHDCGPESDVYSVGQIAFRLATGRSPQGNTGSIQQHPNAMPGSLCLVLERFRSYERAARPADAGVALSELDFGIEERRRRSRPWLPVFEVIDRLYPDLESLASRLHTGERIEPLRGSDAYTLRLAIENAVHGSVSWLEEVSDDGASIVEISGSCAIKEMSDAEIGVVRGPELCLYVVVDDDDPVGSTSWAGTDALFDLLSKWREPLLSGVVALLPARFTVDTENATGYGGMSGVDVSKIWSRSRKRNP